jgi:hypothetical protein
MYTPTLLIPSITNIFLGRRFKTSRMLRRADW